MAWINSIFLVMNLLILLRIFFCTMKMRDCDSIIAVASGEEAVLSSGGTSAHQQRLVPNSTQTN